MNTQLGFESKRTISFDFDFTLFDETENCFITESVQLLRQFLRDGFRVIIVTSRIPVWADEAKELINQHLHLDLEVFSAPGNADDWRDFEAIKSDVLLEQNASIHFDDLIDCSSLTKAKLNGVEIKLPPATKATVARMY
jgi:hypothetical protein